MCRPARTNNNDSEPLSKDDAWIEDFDLKAFTEEIRQLGEVLEKQQGEADVRHLNKMIGWSNACATVGILSMGFSVNIVTIVALSLWTFSRWTMIAHHTCHGGYDRCHPNKGRWNRFKFALGTLWRRMCDWFDWMVRLASNSLCSSWIILFSFFREMMLNTHLLRRISY